MSRVLVVALVGLSAVGLMLWLTAQGPGVNADATAYLEMASNLHPGRLFYAAGAPAGHFPPAYPLLLAAAGSIAANSLEGARWLNAILFGVNLVLFGLLIFESTERSVPAAALGALLFATSAPILRVHSYVSSEPAFLSLALAGMLLLSAHLVWPRLRLLIVSSIFLGLATATRYVGMALLAPMLVGLLGLRDRDEPHRTRDAIVAFAIACAPLWVVLIRNMTIAGSPTDRSLAVHPVTMTHLHSFVVTLHDFVLPLPIANAWKAVDLALLSGVFAAGIALFLSPHTGRLSRLTLSTVIPVLSLVFGVGYLALLVVSISFLDVTTSLDSRLLSPFVVFVAPALFSVAWSASRRPERPALWWIVITVCVIVVAVNANRTLRWAVETRRHGQGYSSPRWRASETVAYVRSLPDDVTIYANDAPAIRFLTGKPAFQIPFDVIPMTGRPNAAYPTELKAMCTGYEERKAVLVWLEEAGPWFGHLRTEFESTCGFRSRLHLADGTVYGARTANR